MIEQEFEDYELKMLSDAVASAKFLTIDDSGFIAHVKVTNSKGFYFGLLHMRLI